MRYSRQRELIAKLLHETTAHPTAYEIYEKARQSEPTISLGTVYRNLSEMSANESVRQIKGADNSIHYDANTAPHPHFICKYCFRVYDIELSGIDALLPCRYQVEELSVNCVGKCINCLNREAQNG